MFKVLFSETGSKVIDFSV
jgi:hypothetical protein